MYQENLKESTAQTRALKGFKYTSPSPEPLAS